MNKQVNTLRGRIRRYSRALQAVKVRIERRKHAPAFVDFYRHLRTAARECELQVHELLPYAANDYGYGYGGSYGG
jgi:hypothetical protein